MEQVSVDKLRSARRNAWITIFVVIWIIIFHYESIRHFYLNSLFRQELPKLKFLFPPAGWIMFFNVDETYGLAEVYGIKDTQPELIDPHEILETKAVLYDNIHRNVLSTVTHFYYKKTFCQFLQRKFPDYDSFVVVAVYYPSVIKYPGKKLYQPIYQCR